MRILNLFQPGRPVLSLEVFPPKTPQGVENLKAKLVQMGRFSPDFISVTYGAGGGTRETTGLISAYIKQQLKIEVLSHLTCIGHTAEDIHHVLEPLMEDNIENIIALRGDPPPGQPYTPPVHGLRHAVDLVRLLAQENRVGVAVAGYPEGHVEAASFEQDQIHLKEKVDAGADFIISQYFLENSRFFRWRDHIRGLGIQQPVEAGLMPAQSLEQITRFSKFCGAAIPRDLAEGLQRFQDNPEDAARFGVDFARAQAEGLLREGVDGIHLYALNKLEPVAAIAPLVHPA